MNHIGRLLVSCALAALLAGCGDHQLVVAGAKIPPIFEDVGDDPHSPGLTLLAIGVGSPDPAPEPPPPVPAADTSRSVTYFPPDAVVTVRPFEEGANVLTLRVSYADAGGDIDAITVRDLDGPLGGDLTLPEFPGASGTFESTLDVPQSAAAGQHRLEIWAQDANGSRSDKTSFTVLVEIF